MTNSRIQKNVSALTLLFILLTAAGCEQSEPEPEVDYSKEGPNGPNAQTEFAETDSGLKYKILREGTGKKPTPQDYVLASYRGWLDDGTEFDSSYSRGEPSSFPLGGVIPGWAEGLQLIGEGGKIELSIPPELGYGASGKPPSIPPNAQLHFIVEVHDVSD
jgi:FKBP-type peptidyl-prolyl cis-trans isomerase